MLKNKEVDYIKLRKPCLIGSGVLIAIGIVLNIVLGIQQDIMFTGGTRLRYTYSGTVDMNKAEQVVRDVLGSDANVSLDTINDTKVITVSQAQEIQVHRELRYNYSGELALEDVQAAAEEALGAGLTAELTVTGEQPQILVKRPGDQPTADQQELLRAKLADEFPDNGITKAAETITGEQTKLLAALQAALPDNNIATGDSQSLQPTLGRTFFLKCLVAVALAGLFLLVYVGFRFRKIGGLSAGTMGILALVHDLIFVYFAFVVFRIPLDDNFVAVMLTILGYSLNDTIVIYDRIRENRRKMKGATVDEIVNKSLNQSFVRTFNVAFCTFLAVLVVTVVGFIWQMDSIISFAVPLLFGIISGFYSSVYLSAPVWSAWVKHSEAKKPKKAVRL